MKVKLTLTEEMLGTKAANKDVFADWIATKHPSGTPQRDELENAKHTEEAGTTIFHRDVTGTLGIYDYQIKGFFKDACGALNRFDKQHRNNLEKLTAYKTKIDTCIFVLPRFIYIQLPPGTTPVMVNPVTSVANEPPVRELVGICERPLRADTAQGPRVTLCRSETVPVGSILEFEVKILSKDLEKYVEEWFKYGALRGLGQWRNSGKGRFTYTLH